MVILKKGTGRHGKRLFYPKKFVNLNKSEFAREKTA